MNVAQSRAAGSSGILDGVRAVGELLREAEAALALDNPDARAARLFVVAAELGDHPEARALLARAADDGSPYAAFELGLMLLGGRGGAVDAAAGLERLAQAAERLPVAAVTLAGALLVDGARAAEGVAWLRRAAAAGEPSAFWLLGVAHLRGLGVAVDAARARVLFQAAAGAGLAEAQLELAALFTRGLGGARDEAAAARWERAAAEAGSAEGCRRVAERLAARPGGLPLALPWLERAAEGGSAEAAARLARLYLRGGELPYDPVAAEHWMERARALGWVWGRPKV